MLRLLAGPLVFFVAAVAAAQPKADAAPAPAAQNVRQLTTTPASAPVPALRLALRVRQADRLPGNAALDYYRAALLVPDWPRDPKESEKHHAKLDGWEAAPLDKLPVADVTAYLDTLAGGFEALDAASRRDGVDWRQGVAIRIERLDDLFRETGKLREIARLNGLRTRRDLAKDDFEAAARNLRSGFRLSQAVGEGSTTLQLLIGISIGAVTIGQADQFVGRPGSPNLYWALADLPRPLIDPRPALDGESVFFEEHVRKTFLAPKESADLCRAVRDDQYKAFRLPYPRATAELAKARTRMKELEKERRDPVVSVFALSVPATEKVYHAFARLDRRLAALTAVEAVRLHAAEHKGTPPAALADVTAVLVPLDPFTGRPFEYAARADGFTLTAAEVEGSSPGNGVRYEVTFRR
ncbi:MAG TPA: hypothetical protein VD866_00625 [Urbifossiella sp.]|nr:hypothetical protein [Urbifossiella sp.]